MSSTGRVATWWTSPEVVLVLEDHPSSVPETKRLFRKAAGKPGNYAALLLTGLVLQSSCGSGRVLQAWGALPRELHCCASFLPRERTVFWLSFLFALFFPPLFSPIFKSCGSAYWALQNTSSTVTCRKRHTTTCLKIFISAVYMYCDLVPSHTTAELRIYWICEPNMWFKISFFFS